MISFDVFNYVLDYEWIWNRYEWQSRTAIHAHGVVKLKYDPSIPRLVATTYSGRLAEEQMGKNSVLNRDYFEQLKDISIGGELAEQNVITYADTLLTAMNSRPRFESGSVAVPDPHPCTKTH